jgi:hypothetical protein
VPVRRALAFVLPLLPSYWALVREEAEYLIGACGAKARAYAAAEAEDAASPVWSAFMRRVESCIARREASPARA